MTRWKLSFGAAALAGACLFLTGCNPHYPLAAQVIDGRLYFVGAQRNWLFEQTGACPRFFDVRAQGGDTAWRIERDVGQSKCEAFPLAYGVAPKRWRTALPPKPLVPGKLYLLHGRGDGVTYYGAFRVGKRLTVRNQLELAHKLR